MPRSCESAAAEAPDGGTERVGAPALGAGTLGAGTLGAGTLGAGTLGAPALGAGTLGAGILGAPALGAVGDGLLTTGGGVTAEGLVAGEALGVALLTAPSASRLQRSMSACVGPCALAVAEAARSPAVASTAAARLVVSMWSSFIMSESRRTRVARMRYK